MDNILHDPGTGVMSDPQSVLTARLRESQHAAREAQHASPEAQQARATAFIESLKTQCAKGILGIRLVTGSGNQTGTLLVTQPSYKLHRSHQVSPEIIEGFTDVFHVAKALMEAGGEPAEGLSIDAEVNDATGAIKFRSNVRVADQAMDPGDTGLTPTQMGKHVRQYVDPMYNMARLLSQNGVPIKGTEHLTPPAVGGRVYVTPRGKGGTAGRN